MRPVGGTVLDDGTSREDQGIVVTEAVVVDVSLRLRAVVEEGRRRTPWCAGGSVADRKS
jgi:hypothetical protein